MNKKEKYRQSEKGKSTVEKYRKSDACKESRKKWRESDAGKKFHREATWRQLGIDMTYSRYLDMLKDCDNNCVLCSDEQNKARKENPKSKSLSVDHCHKTGRIRGLLCGPHNVSLELFESSQMKILQYLNKGSI